jgi:GTP:adenosylcobinamide-phosphate guanylyltransferase
MGETVMVKKRDAVILAGTKNYPKFQIGNRHEHKQYLELDGRYVIEYVLDAALQASAVETIYIVCDPQKIKPVLDRYPAAQRGRLENIIENKDSLIQNVQQGMQHTKNTILLPSDAPFLTAADIDAFAAVVADDTDYALGFSDGSALDTVFEKMDIGVQKEQIKMGLFPIRHGAIRISNLHIVNATALEKPELDLADRVFTNRKLLDTSGKRNIMRWASMAYACLQYFHDRHYHPKIFVGSCSTALLGGLFYLASYYREFSVGELFCYPLHQHAFETTLNALTAGNVKIQTPILSGIRPMFDIDVPETYALLARGDTFRRMREVLKEY